MSGDQGLHLNAHSNDERHGSRQYGHVYNGNNMYGYNAEMAAYGDKKMYAEGYGVNAQRAWQYNQYYGQNGMHGMMQPQMMHNGMQHMGMPQMNMHPMQHMQPGMPSNLQGLPVMPMQGMGMPMAPMPDMNQWDASLPKSSSEAAVKPPAPPMVVQAQSVQALPKEGTPPGNDILIHQGDKVFLGRLLENGQGLMLARLPDRRFDMEEGAEGVGNITEGKKKAMAKPDGNRPILRSATKRLEAEGTTTRLGAARKRASEWKQPKVSTYQLLNNGETDELDGYSDWEEGSNGGSVDQPAGATRSTLPGVVFDKSGKKWTARWNHGGKQFKKTFAASKYGYEKARDMAESCRMEAFGDRPVDAEKVNRPMFRGGRRRGRTSFLRAPNGTFTTPSKLRNHTTRYRKLHDGASIDSTASSEGVLAQQASLIKAQEALGPVFAT